MSERLKYEGRLAMLRQDAAKLRIQLDGLVKSLRENIDPLERIEKLPGDIIAQQAVNFSAKQSVLLETLDEIRRAEEILGKISISHTRDGEKPSWP